MEKNSTSKSFDYMPLLHSYLDKGYVTKKEHSILLEFLKSYKAVLAEKSSVSSCELVLKKYLERIKDFSQHPFQFEPYHEQIRKPFDYYAFGLEFLRPLVDSEHSTLLGLANFDIIATYLKEKNNVVFFANHQIEADPQAISLLLEKTHPKIGEEMIFVAGERVLTDPLAVPFSMGRNLLCIYSKKYIDSPPEEKRNKQLHNKKTMQLMSELLSQGGKSIYVAPSGGRDRPNAQGIVEVAPFDSKSIEMFYLMARKAKRPTHFFPLSLKTYALLPPPSTIQIELGEARQTHGGAIHLNLGSEIDMEHSPGSDEENKHKKREVRAKFIWNLVRNGYERLS